MPLLDRQVTKRLCQEGLAGTGRSDEEHILGLAPDQQLNADNIRYSQDEEAVLQALEKEDFQAAFILNPPKAADILTIATGGEKMPQKSTYFYPKLISGLIVNKIDPKEEIGEQTEA